MAEILVTAIRTEKGDQRIDYNALANLPEFDDTLSGSGKIADAKTVGDKLREMIKNINTKIEEHKYSAEDVTSGTFSTDRIPVVPMSKGGTEATSGSDGLKNLLAAGPMVLSSNQYGPSSELPASAVIGQIFFVKAEVGE